jgi:hypothetical protein
MKRFSGAAALVAVVAFVAGLGAHFLYQRWTAPLGERFENLAADAPEKAPKIPTTTAIYPTTYIPIPTAVAKPAELPLLQARDVEKIRELSGSHARIRGRVFRVGHSQKSNTYFLNFGPSREALTAVIFASAVELFEKDKLSPTTFDGREVELSGEIKNHPQYGLEVILETPSQIKVVN